jgi:hypothetical protein
MHPSARVAFAVVVAGCMSAPALGYTEPPWQSYTRPSPNKAFVFVMLHRAPGDPRPNPVADQYPVSGLYRAGDSTTPVWAFPDGYARDAYPASDGAHVVVQHLHVITDGRTCGNSPPEPAPNPDVLAVYASGKKLRDVRLGELLDPEQFRRDHGAGWHGWLSAGTIDDAAGEFVVETTDGRRTRLDLETGYVVSGPRAFCGTPPGPSRNVWGLLLGLGLAGFALGGAAAAGLLFLRSRPKLAG